MPKPGYSSCKYCGRGRDEVGPLSHTRLCGDCAKAIYEANMDAMHNQSGPFYEHWAYQWFLAARKRILEMPPTTT